MIGRRIPDGEFLERYGASELQDGDYGFIENEHGDDGRVLWAMLPGGSGAFRNDGRWTVEEHDDGTVTVSPSIWHDKPHGWHGFLRAGEWQKA
jgi:hypothetical protein